MNPEAIEAAAMAIYANNGYDGSGFELGDYRSDARAALEAAAPYLLREARAAELEAVADWLALPRQQTDPLVAALRARAAAIRAGEA